MVSVPHSEIFAFNLRIKRSSELKLSKEYINTSVIYARYGHNDWNSLPSS